MEELEDLAIHKLTLVCSSMDVSPLLLGDLHTILKQRTLRCKNMTLRFVALSGTTRRRSSSFREWQLEADPSVPIVASPMETLHLDSCHIMRTGDLAHSLKLTVAQKRLVKKAAAKPLVPKQESSRLKKPTTSRTTAPVRKRPPFLQKLEVSGSTCFVDMKFLDDRAYERAEREICGTVPSLLVDMSDVYYFD